MKKSPTFLQTSWQSSENFEEYSSWSSFTLRSTSSRFTFSFRARNGPCKTPKLYHHTVYFEISILTNVAAINVSQQNTGLIFIITNKLITG